MAISYAKVAKTPYVLRQLTGLTKEEFEKTVEKVRPEWKKVEKQKKCQGRKSHIETLEDKILCILIYCRTYITHPFLGFLFNLHNSNICRLLKKMEPLLAKKITIKKDRTMTTDGILKILADVTEQPVQRPKDNKKRKKSYSGKKKTTTIKTEIVIEENGQILSISKLHRARF